LARAARSNPVRHPDREGSIESWETNAGPTLVPRHLPVRLASAAACRFAATSCSNPEDARSWGLVVSRKISLQASVEHTSGCAGRPNGIRRYCSYLVSASVVQC
jgi:hypothetical protein